ncbi:hypothetical protein [Cupriavidus sp. D39]|nr:hypothetical protein [Cupriavidus sp. D39]MCY0853705.1 hypothetical protein [Cupriavidus sp. D39]
MRLITYQATDGFQRAGALFDGDQAVLDLRHASQIVRGEMAPAWPACRR